MELVFRAVLNFILNVRHIAQTFLILRVCSNISW